MYMSKKKFDEIKAKHSTTIVVDADVGGSGFCPGLAGG